jgi:hypothetical protein
LAQDAAAPVVSEPAFTGSAEVGYRFRGDLAGLESAYRSVVDLGEGPRLLNLDLSSSPSAKWLDELVVRAANWGGDPYNNAYLRARKTGLYEVSVDYRSLAYFNALPSFANPGFDMGLLTSQRTFDTRRRYLDLNVDLRPGKRIVPFFGYRRDSGDGRGVTLYVPSLNEYPVPTEYDDSTDTYRGGVRLEQDRWHATLEVGGFLFRDRQQVFGPATPGTGNRTTPIGGQQLFLRDASQLYDVDGDAVYVRGNFTGSPFSWLDLHGNVIYTRPELTTNFNESAAGQLAQSNPILFYQSYSQLLAAVARQPHTRASGGFELRPHERVRVLYSFYTDRLNTDSSGTGSETLGTAPAVAFSVADTLNRDYSQSQVEALFDVGRGLTLRGGHRYVWGESLLRPGQLTGEAGLRSGSLKRSTALGGVSYRPAQRLAVNLDAEIANGEEAYFRTSLLDYQRVRARVRYQALNALAFTYSGSYFNNDNPLARVGSLLTDFEARSIDHALAIFWTPQADSRVRVLAEYARQTWRSDTEYFVPQTLTPERSLYTENAHVATLAADIRLLKNTISPTISFGGSLFDSSGSRPTQYAQPFARILVPFAPHLQFTGEWRYWGLSQTFYQFEHFRTHQGTVGLRWSQ